jgi:hypothetical protein
VLLRVTIALESVARESPKLLPRAIAHFVNFIEGRRKFGNGFARADVTDVTDLTDVSPREEGRRKKEEGRGKKEEGRGKKQE